jgi:hypothetical protein
MQAQKPIRPRKKAILVAMSEVESLLHNEPEFVGESREADKRLLIVGPLAVTYKINSRDRIVKILRVKIQLTTD